MKLKRPHGQYLMNGDIVVIEAKILEDADPLDATTHNGLVKVELTNGAIIKLQKQTLRRRNVVTETIQCSTCKAQMQLDLYNQCYVCPKCDNWKPIR